MCYQKAVLRKPCEKTVKCKSEIDFYNYFKKIYVNEYEPPVKGSFELLMTDSDPAESWEEFGRKVVWYGKMGSRSYKDTIEIM